MASQYSGKAGTEVKSKVAMGARLSLDSTVVWTQAAPSPPCASVPASYLGGVTHPCRGAVRLECTKPCETVSSLPGKRQLCVACLPLFWAAHWDPGFWHCPAATRFPSRTVLCKTAPPSSPSSSPKGPAISSPETPPHSTYPSFPSSIPVFFGQ